MSWAPKAEVLIRDFVNYCFYDDTEKRKFQNSSIPLPFLKKWKVAVSGVIGQMNDALRLKNDSSLLQRQHITTFTQDILTVSSIKKKMVALLEGMKLKVLPVIAKTGFWGTRSDQQIKLKFCFVKVIQEEVRTIITTTKEGVPVRMDSRAENAMDMETKLQV